MEFALLRIALLKYYNAMKSLGLSTTLKIFEFTLSMLLSFNEIIHSPMSICRNKTQNLNMKLLNCVTGICLLSLCSSSIASGTITVTATPYEALPFPEGFKCFREGVFPHKVHCEKYWFCQKEDSGAGFKPAELYHCPTGYSFDRNIDFCNRREQVTCSTLGKEKLAKALDIMKETQKLELRLKEIESNLKKVSRNDQESNQLEPADEDTFFAANSDNLLSLIL